MVLGGRRGAEAGGRGRTGAGKSQGKAARSRQTLSRCAPRARPPETRSLARSLASHPVSRHDPHNPFHQDYARAVSVFERAVTLDPSFAKGVNERGGSDAGLTHRHTSPTPRLFLLTRLLVPPSLSKAWVSWAQLEKRACPDSRRAVAVLQVAAQRLMQQRGGGDDAGALLHQPAAPVLQAWALLELQRGNFLAATRLLARAVDADPERCSPVLRWAPVRAAAAAVQERGEKGADGRG
jgi:hypothetical protein